LLEIGALIQYQIRGCSPQYLCKNHLTIAQTTWHYFNKYIGAAEK
jgi:hypothetical protein